ncbi:unnamed protein product [Brachionus calyciflorus]|uniref:Cyclic nucleotide-binding domain-containing protein n=1 Tax=Brachionus calyciflorus TaxID=104777 RepID=A0A813MA47_9BILA|nr:unnamed protein product [Brachionus calyciflorus]
MESDKEKVPQKNKNNFFNKIKNYVFDPTEDLYYNWLIVISLAVLYNLVFVIGRSAFELLQEYNPIIWWILDYSCDLIYIIDIFVRLRTGYLEQGLLLRDFKKLALTYLKSFQFKLDILSVIPFEILNLFLTKNLRPNYRFNRLIKINRLFECRLKIETRTSYPFLFRIIYLVFVLVFLIHWNACFYFMISKTIGLGSDKWVFNNQTNHPHKLTFQYISCFLWSTLMLTTIGEVENPTNTVESLVMVVNFFMALVLVASLVGNISSVISNMNIENDKFKRRVDAIKSLMKLRKVSKSLDTRVIKWFDYLHKNEQNLDENEILNNLPDKLEIEIASYIHLETLRNINIFADCEEGLLRELVTKLRIQVYSPGDYVCRKGDIGKEMFIIKKGLLDVVSDDGQKIFVTLKPGAFFGEISILNIPGNKIGNRRTANVRSVGYSDLLRLSKQDLWDVLNDYTANRDMLIERGKEKLRKDNLLDEEVITNNDKVDKNVDNDVDDEIKPFEECKIDRKLELIENKYEALAEKLENVIKDLNEIFDAKKKRVQNIKDIFDKKIGFLKEGTLVRDLNVLMSKTLKEKQFYLIDLMSILPTDILYFILKNYDFWPIIRANRLLRITRILEFRSQTETSTNFPYFFRILTIFTFILIIIHWNACLLFLLNKYFDVFDQRNIQFNRAVDFTNNTVENKFFIQYAACFYKSTLLLTTISNIEPPSTLLEMLYLTLSFLNGVLVFALIVGSITEIIDDLNMKRSEFQEKVDGVKNYMQLAKVDTYLQERVIKWFNHSWSNNSGMDEKVIFEEFLPENLQAEIAMNIHLETLKRVNIFQDCEPGLLQQLVTRLKLRVYSPSDFICRKGDIGREMYIIKSGKLSVVSDDCKKVFATLSEGSCFGEISILDIEGSRSGNRRTANVISVGYSDLFCLTKGDLWQVLAEYPLAKEALLEKGRSILRKDGLLIEANTVEAEKIKKRKENISEYANFTRDELDNFDKRIDYIKDLIKRGMILLDSRIEKSENKIKNLN